MLGGCYGRLRRMPRQPDLTSSRMEIIAERDLTSEQDMSVSVKVRIAKPVRDPEGVWTCTIYLSGDERLQPALNAYGEDSVQALLLAFDMARAYLSSTEAEGLPRLRWLGGDPW